MRRGREPLIALMVIAIAVPLTPASAISSEPVSARPCSIGATNDVTDNKVSCTVDPSRALKEKIRERVPLQWALTQDDLGSALLALGERESETPRLEEELAAFRAAVEE